jgi:hypothetical protein
MHARTHANALLGDQACPCTLPVTHSTLLTQPPPPLVHTSTPHVLRALPRVPVLDGRLQLRLGLLKLLAQLQELRLSERVPAWQPRTTSSGRAPAG